MIKYILTVIFLMILLSCSVPIKEKTVIRTRLNDIDISTLPPDLSVLADPRSGQWSVYVYELDSSSPLFEYNKHRDLLPASNMKIVTAAAALKVLGPDFRFKTEFYTDGYIDKKLNLLKGNIFVKGGRDPSLGGQFLKELDIPELHPVIDSLKLKLGIDYIEGDIYFDNPVKFNEMYGRGWDIDDIPYYYSPVISPLTFHENFSRITLYNGKTEILPYYPFKIRKDTVPDLEKTAFERIIGTDSLVITSSFKKWSRGWVTVQHPEIFFKKAFEKLLQDNNISLLKNDTLITDGQKFPLCTIYSDSLYSLIHKTNTESNNLYAEQIFRKTATAASELPLLPDSLKKKDPDYNDLLKITADLYQRIFGIDNFSVCDGSGLSRRNFISSENIVKVLRIMFQDTNFITYLSSFARPGIKGTLEQKFTHPDLIGRTFIKTGSMTGVNCISGYLLTRKNKRLAFSIMNNYYDYSRYRSNEYFENMLVHLVNNY